MVSPELQKKFEELFIDEFTKEQYEEWKQSTYVESKFDKGFKWIALTVATILFLIAILQPFYLNRDRLVQEVRGKSFSTYVWINGNISKSWYTPIDQLTDSIKTAQRNEGERLLKMLK